MAKMTPRRTNKSKRSKDSTRELSPTDTTRHKEASDFLDFSYINKNEMISNPNKVKLTNNNNTPGTKNSPVKRPQW